MEELHTCLPIGKNRKHYGRHRVSQSILCSAKKCSFQAKIQASWSLSFKGPNFGRTCFNERWSVLGERVHERYYSTVCYSTRFQNARGDVLGPSTLRYINRETKMDASVYYVVKVQRLIVCRESEGVMSLCSTAYECFGSSKVTLTTLDACDARQRVGRFELYVLSSTSALQNSRSTVA